MITSWVSVTPAYHKILGSVKGWRLTPPRPVRPVPRGTCRRSWGGSRIDLTHCREPDGSVTQKKIWLAFARTEIAFFSWSNALRTGFLAFSPGGVRGVLPRQWYITLLRASVRADCSNPKLRSRSASSSRIVLLFALRTTAMRPWSALLAVARRL